jgi:hypothetical protein
MSSSSMNSSSLVWKISDIAESILEIGLLPTISFFTACFLAIVSTAHFLIPSAATNFSFSLIASIRSLLSLSTCI